MSKIEDIKITNALCSLAFYTGLFMVATTIVSARVFPGLQVGKCWFIWGDWIWVPYIVLAWRHRARSLMARRDPHG